MSSCCFLFKVNTWKMEQWEYNLYVMIAAQARKCTILIPKWCKTPVCQSICEHIWKLKYLFLLQWPISFGYSDIPNSLLLQSVYFFSSSDNFQDWFYFRWVQALILSLLVCSIGVNRPTSVQPASEINVIRTDFMSLLFIYYVGCRSLLYLKWASHIF